MKTILTLSLSFLIILLTIVATVVTEKFFTPSFRATGIVKYQEEFPLTVSCMPPEGYFLSSNCFERLYISHEDIASFNGKRVSINGVIGEIRGRDYTAQFPLLIVNELTVIE